MASGVRESNVCQMIVADFDLGQTEKNARRKIKHESTEWKIKTTTAALRSDANLQLKYHIIVCIHMEKCSTCVCVLGDEIEYQSLYTKATD